MNFKDLKLESFDCKDDTKVIVYVKDEVGYRPFENIKVHYYDESCSGSINELHIDVNINREYNSHHFPNNPEKKYIEDLLEEKRELKRKLKKIEEDLGYFNDME